MPLSANLLKLGSSILPRVKRARNRNNVATEKRNNFFSFSFSIVFFLNIFQKFSKFQFLSLIFKFTWKIGNRLNRKKNQFPDFSDFYFFELCRKTLQQKIYWMPLIVNLFCPQSKSTRGSEAQPRWRGGYIFFCPPQKNMYIFWVFFKEKKCSK